MLKRNDVIYAYRLILGRDPESEEVIENYQKIESISKLREIMLASDEFRRIAENIIVDNIRAYDFSNIDEKIDVIIDNNKMKKLLSLVINEWEALGKEDPYWSVLTFEEYKIKNINDERLREFYISGRHSVDSLKKLIEGCIGTFNVKSVLELGCGVGRCTIHLCNDFDYVYAVDVSSSNIKICENYLKNNGVKNFQCLILRDTEMESLRGRYDLFYSIITLQHNPPPVQYAILKSALDNLKEGGIACFQIYSHGLGYQFKLEEYFRSYKKGMKMHCLPLKYVFNLASQTKSQILDVFPDDKTGIFGSYTVIMKKF